MKKLLISLMTVAFIVSASNIAFATFKCPPGQEKKGWKCVDIEVPDTSGVINNNNNENKNTNTNLNTNINNNKNDNKNTNTNVNLNANKNKNVNKNSNKQAQGQAQAQIQGQSQSSVNDNSNKGNTQETNIKFEDSVSYNHVMAPVVSSDAKFSEGKGDEIRTLVKLPSGYMSYNQAKRLARNADDFDLIADELNDIDYATKSIYVTANSDVAFGMKLVGWIYVIGDGRESTRTSGVGLAMKKAMKMGGTVAIKVNESSSVISDGSSWSISTGGGMSVSPQDSGRLMVSGTGGLGLAGVTGSNYAAPSLAFAIFADENVADKVIYNKPISR